MKDQSARKQAAQRVYLAAAQLINASYNAGRLTEAEFDQLNRALEAINTDRLNAAELTDLLKIDE
jgi:hypothetical protein